MGSSSNRPPESEFVDLKQRHLGHSLVGHAVMNGGREGGAVSVLRTQVLFLDDDEDLRVTLSELVASSCNVECITAASLSELVSMRDRILPCALAILDVNLGDGEESGIDAYDWLRQQGYAGKIVFLTGHAASYPPVQAAARLGDARILQKPVEPGVLLDLVRGVAA